MWNYYLSTFINVIDFCLLSGDCGFGIINYMRELLCCASKVYYLFLFKPLFVQEDRIEINNFFLQEKPAQEWQ